MSKFIDMQFRRAKSLAEALIFARRCVERVMTNDNLIRNVLEEHKGGFEFSDEPNLYKLFNFQFAYWPEQQVLGVVGNFPDERAFPLSVTFHNSTDPDYMLDSWRTGKVPFFDEMAEKYEKLSLDDIVAAVEKQGIGKEKVGDDKDGHYRRVACYYDIHETLQMTRFMYDEMGNFAIFAMNGITNPTVEWRINRQIKVIERKNNKKEK